MGLVSFLRLLGPRSRTSKSLQMPQAPWALERFSTANGSLVRGQCLNNLYLWLIELFPIVMAAHLWGSQWSMRRVEFLCDNESVVAVLSSCTSRDADLMVLLRYLALLGGVCHSFSFKASSVRGKANLVADSLSRFQLQRLRHLAPHAAETPTPIPPALLTALQVT